jgi:ABC-type spermidine/putrescine transport system permease subunit I
MLFGVIFLFPFLILLICIFFTPHFGQVCQGSVNLVSFFKKPAFCFLDSLMVFVVVVAISLILAYIFYYFSPSACFGFCFFLFF